MDKTRAAIHVFDKRAQQYMEKYMDVSLYAGTLDAFCETLPHGARVLELACGPGNITKYLLGRRPDLQILATDLAPQMLRLAKANNPGIETLLLDCREIDKLDSRYNGIIAGFCLPYLSREEALELIKDATQKLNPGGLLYLSIMEGDYKKSSWQRSEAGDELFIYYHDAGYLLDTLHDNGFARVDVYRKAQDAASTDLILIAHR